MHVLSVNIGVAQTILNAKESGKTGIYKRPVEDRVTVTANGLAGDAICDTENHGGVDQAVYICQQLSRKRDSLRLNPNAEASGRTR
jgi:MOSC domain-containing protein YiiM